MCVQVRIYDKSSKDLGTDMLVIRGVCRGEGHVQQGELNQLKHAKCVRMICTIKVLKYYTWYIRKQ